MKKVESPAVDSSTVEAASKRRPIRGLEKTKGDAEKTRIEELLADKERLEAERERLGKERHLFYEMNLSNSRNRESWIEEMTKKNELRNQRIIQIGEFIGVLKNIGSFGNLPEIRWWTQHGYSAAYDEICNYNRILQPALRRAAIARWMNKAKQDLQKEEDGLIRDSEKIDEVDERIRKEHSLDRLWQKKMDYTDFGRRISEIDVHLLEIYRELKRKGRE